MKNLKKTTFLLLLLFLSFTVIRGQNPQVETTPSSLSTDKDPQIPPRLDTLIIAPDIHIDVSRIKRDSNKYEFKVQNFPRKWGIHKLTEEKVFFHWSFGDGKYSNKYQPTHKYKVKGTYRVTFRAISRYTSLGDLADAETKIKAPKAKKTAYPIRRKDQIIRLEGLSPMVPEAHMPMHLEYSNIFGSTKKKRGKIWIFYNSITESPFLHFKRPKFYNNEQLLFPSDSLDKRKRPSNPSFDPLLISLPSSHGKANLTRWRFSS